MRHVAENGLDRAVRPKLAALVLAIGLAIWTQFAITYQYILEPHTILFATDDKARLVMSLNDAGMLDPERQHLQRYTCSNSLRRPVSGGVGLPPVGNKDKEAAEFGGFLLLRTNARLPLVAGGFDCTYAIEATPVRDARRRNFELVLEYNATATLQSAALRVGGGKARNRRKRKRPAPHELARLTFTSAESERGLDDGGFSYRGTAIRSGTVETDPSGFWHLELGPLSTTRRHHKPAHRVVKVNWNR